MLNATTSDPVSLGGATLADPMATRRTERTIQTAVRFPASWLPRLERIAERLSSPGIDVSQAAAIRAVMSRGLDALEAELGITEAEAKPKPKPTKGKARK